MKKRRYFTEFLSQLKASEVKSQIYIVSMMKNVTYLEQWNYNLIYLTSSECHQGTGRKGKGTGSKDMGW